MARFIKVKSVKELAKESGKRVGRGFIARLDAHIETLISKAVKQHNGGKVTLDADVATFVGAK